MNLKRLFGGKVNPDLESQVAICRKYNVKPSPVSPFLKVGIARNVKEGLLPLNGFRGRPTANTTGWYFWAGELSEADDFFVPLHVEHLKSWSPQVIPYLLLPRGWRLQIAPGYEDVWFDETLLIDD